MAARRGFGQLNLDTVLRDLGVLAGSGLYQLGLNAPRNLLSYATVALGALAIASAIYVIMDLDQPFDGIFSVSSQPLRDALIELDQ